VLANQRKRREYVMAGTLADFAAWTFAISCGTCHHQRILPVANLLVLYDSGMRVGQIIGRFRCSTPGCGSRHDRVVISNRLREVPLIGQGAFG
jgi:hypothetical protein